MLKNLVLYLLSLLFLILSVNTSAKETSIQHQGLKINANLELASNKSITDGVILITHGGLGHYKMDTIAYLQYLLAQQGHNSLAITLSLGLNNRHGMYDCSITHTHRHTDAVDEIGAWVKWLQTRKVMRIILLGHSRGGAQTTLYAVLRADTNIKAVILMAPATRDNGANGYQKRYEEPLKPALLFAQHLFQQGKGQTTIPHSNLLFCRDTTVTAAAFLSYYNDDTRLDTPLLLERISIPTLLIIAENDNIVKNLSEKVAHFKNEPLLTIMQIEDADHFFRDLNSDEAVELINEYLITLSI